MADETIVPSPGGMESGLLAVFMFNALIETLRAKNLLSDAEILAMLEGLLSALEKDHRSAAKEAASVVRQAIKDYRV